MKEFPSVEIIGTSGEDDRARVRDATQTSDAGHAWLARTFAGLTWGRFTIYCLIVAMFALSRPSAMNAILHGDGLAARVVVLVFPLAFVWLKFTPVLLAVVAAANHAPRTGRARVYWLLGALVIGQVVGTTVGAISAPIVAPPAFLARMGMHDSLGVRALRWGGMGLQDFVIPLIATGWWYYLDRNREAAAAVHRAQYDREEAERESAEARLQVMQAQIEPHFLFNSLASIRRLYETDPGSGRAMLQHLSRYLSASLPILREAQSTLGREVALAVAYLGVQEIRMGNRLAVDVDVPQPLHAIVVPPMMLATLVENAVIHGLSPLPEGGRISITARVDAGRISIQVADTGRGLHDSWGAGIGLANIRARLHSEFGDAADLELTNSPDRGVTATIQLPLASSAQALAA